LAVQQFGIVVLVHVCVFKSHASAVHALPSLQSAFALQQPTTVPCVHVFVIRSQASAVHALPSLQSALVLQQVGMGWFVQVWLV